MANPLYFDLETIGNSNNNLINSYNLYAIGDDRKLHYAAVNVDSVNFPDPIHFKESHTQVIDRTVNNNGFMKVKNGVVYFVMATGTVGSALYIMQKYEDDYISARPNLFGSRYTSYLEVDDGLILAGGDGGLAISNNNGKTWRYPLLSPQQAMPSITTITSDGVFLYVGIDSDDGGFLISGDKGETWSVHYPNSRYNTMLPGRIKKILSQSHEDIKWVYLVQDAGISLFVISSATKKILEWKPALPISVYGSGNKTNDLVDKDLIDGYASDGYMLITAVGQGNKTANIVKYHISPVKGLQSVEPITEDQYFNPNGSTKMKLRTTETEAPGRAFVLDATNVLSGGDTYGDKWASIDINKI